MTDKEIQEIKERVARAIRIVVNEGLIEWSGHLSARIPGTRHFCVLGHLHEEGRSLAATTADDIVTVDLDGKLVEGGHEPPGEVSIHTELYKARSDISSVLHTHPPAATALGVSGAALLPLNISYGLVFADGVPVFPSACQINTPEVGQELAKVLGNKNAALMKGHGAVSVGTSIEHCCSVSLFLEKAARFQLMATQFGEPQPISAVDLARYAGRKWDSEESRQRFWDFYGGRLPK